MLNLSVHCTAHNSPVRHQQHWLWGLGGKQKMEEEIFWKGKWFCSGDIRTLKTLDVSTWFLCKKNTLDIHGNYKDKHIVKKSKTYSKSFHLSTAGCVTQTFLIPWLIIVITYSMTQHETLLPKHYTQFWRSSPVAQHHKPQIHSSCCSHSLLSTVKSRFQKPSQNDLVHPIWPSLLTALPLLPQCNVTVNLQIETDVLKTGNKYMKLRFMPGRDHNNNKASAVSV